MPLYWHSESPVHASSRNLWGPTYARYEWDKAEVHVWEFLQSYIAPTWTNVHIYCMHHTCGIPVETGTHCSRHWSPLAFGARVPFRETFHFLSECKAFSNWKCWKDRAVTSPSPPRPIREHFAFTETMQGVPWTLPVLSSQPPVLIMQQGCCPARGLEVEITGVVVSTRVNSSF